MSRVDAARDSWRCAEVACLRRKPFRDKETGYWIPERIVRSRRSTYLAIDTNGLDGYGQRQNGQGQKQKIMPKSRWPSDDPEERRDRAEHRVWGKGLKGDGWGERDRGIEGRGLLDGFF